MEKKIDERRFGELMEESSDLQVDAMKIANRDLDGYVEAAKEAEFEARSERRERSLVAPALIAAGALGVTALATSAPAFAAASKDVQALQTAASIENLAILTYKTAYTLPFIGGKSANGVVKAFAKMTLAQHMDHAAAFNAAVVKLGGKKQSKPDPKYLPVVTKAVPTLKTALDVVGLAITLEDVAAETYVADTGIVSTSELRQLFSSVAGVESQHKAILLAVQALLKANAADLIALPPNAAKLPAAAGSVGFPDSFYPTKSASPVTEGAVT